MTIAFVVTKTYSPSSYSTVCELVGVFATREEAESHENDESASFTITPVIVGQVVNPPVVLDSYFE